jgi:RNase H-fold protein (predicted Holliday junction resolvase)
VTVLGVDPGRDKCGVAVCQPDRVLARAVVPPADLPGLVTRWAAEYLVGAVVVGGGTGSSEVIAALSGLAASARLPALVVEAEVNTTLAARRRYFEEHPPQGWRRLVPVSFQVPPEPYDDYAAAVIAEAYLERTAEKRQNP